MHAFDSITSLYGTAHIFTFYMLPYSISGVTPDVVNQVKHHETSVSSSTFVYDRSMATQSLPAPSPLPTHRLPPRPSEQGEAGPSYVIISGGTGANSIVSAFGPSPAFVLPVSDDGGSSAEILRCFGGPSIGDIRKAPTHCMLRVTRMHPGLCVDGVI